MSEGLPSSHPEQQYLEQELCSACSLPPRRDNKGDGIPLRKCMRCHSAQYHDAACQRLHYPKHKNICRNIGVGSIGQKISSNPHTRHVIRAPYRIQDGPSKGKCMLANIEITAGQSIGNPEEFAPLAAPVLFEGHRSSRCACCFSTQVDCNVGDDKRYIAHLCRSCVNTDHAESLRREVHAVGMSTQIPRILATAILVYRICVRVLSNARDWEWVSCMISHPILQEDPNAVVHQKAIVMTVLTMLGTTGQSMDIDRITGILSRIKVNAFTITDSNGESLGIGLYRTSHYINHCCSPNTRQSFLVGIAGCVPKLKLTSTTTIQEGEEITISYVDTCGLTGNERRKQLLQSYHFLCECPTCQHESKT